MIREIVLGMECVRLMKVVYVYMTMWMGSSVRRRMTWGFIG